MVTIAWYVGVGGALLAVAGMVPGFYKIGKAHEEKNKSGN
jgi:hypothetical protein